ncbi:hypothetical protein I551_1208 [Mycobacterium ulcerans str. Harvey]|uniref:Uncharacterized protein n=1 Tax=Mycobacterium ulcerans str. Harvey TaxID=1299332 RepID=A0ABN0R696_MYCUL|nr:hypothetical protein I551_1208 [Mycobacterium ulcerans str. Harvey]
MSHDGVLEHNRHLEDFGPTAARACPLRPAPSTRIDVGSVHSTILTRTSCSGASGGPTKSSVDSAETTCMTAPYGAVATRQSYWATLWRPFGTACRPSNAARVRYVDQPWRM